LELAPLYDVVEKESNGLFLDANDCTLGSEEPWQICYLTAGIKSVRAKVAFHRHHSSGVLHKPKASGLGTNLSRETIPE
jgi:hypothetical protein